MERISDEKLDALLAEGCKREDFSKDGHVLTMMLLQELKERRAVDKPLDIKGWLRLVRDKCPDVWKVLAIDAICPADLSIGSALSDCHAGLTSNKNCKECWDKALEGDE